MDKDARIAQLEEALLLCSSLLDKEFAARAAAEEKWFSLAKRIVTRETLPVGLKQMPFDEFSRLAPGTTGEPVAFAVWPDKGAA